MKSYYDKDGIRIFHGDCREILPQLGIRFDLVVVDPPYGINHSSSHGASWQNTTIQNDHSTDLRDWIIAQFPDTPMIVFGSWKVVKPANTRQTLIWDKGPAFGMGDLSLPWKNSFEEIYVLGDGFTGKRDEAILRWHPIVSWESKGRKHPHEKPVSLMEYFLGKTNAEHVLDPCCGTGPVLVAAKNAQLRVVGIEIEERYCEIAAKRLEQGVLAFEVAQ